MKHTFRHTFHTIGGRTGEFARDVGFETAHLARRFGGRTAHLARRVGRRRGLLGLAQHPQAPIPERTAGPSSAASSAAGSSAANGLPGDRARRPPNG